MDKFLVTLHFILPCHNVWLGAGVVVLPGVNIGDNSVIAANSVVCSDVPENALYAGTPAVLKRHIDINLQQNIRCCSHYWQLMM